MVLDIAVASDGGQNKRTLVKLDKVDLRMCRAGDHGHIGTWSDMSTAISVTWSEVSDLNMVRLVHGLTWSGAIIACYTKPLPTFATSLPLYYLPKPAAM